MSSLALETVCERLVPGSTKTGSPSYVSAIIARKPHAERAMLERSIVELGALTESEFASRARTPEFAALRSLVIEAYYGGYVAPGAPGPSSWDAIGFETAATRRETRTYTWVQPEL